MRRFAAMRDLDVWYARVDVEALFELRRKGASKRQIATYRQEMARARRKDSLRALSRLSRRVDGVPRIVSEPPLIVPIEEVTGSRSRDEIERALRGLLASYRATLDGDRRLLAARYRYVHAAHKVVGVGSVGAQAWIILMLGRDSDDPLFMQAKEAQRSVLAPHAGRSRYAHQGRRVVEGQRLMQATGDVFLGWVTSEARGDRPRDFYVRQLWDGKWSADVALMGPSQLARYARLCGWTLARAHARSGDRIAIASYLGKSAAFDEAVADFAESYADQNQRDYEALVEDVRAGDLVVREGV